VTNILAGALVIAALALARPAAAEPCPGGPEALGTSRTIAVDAASTPRVGRKHFPTTLALADKEVVLTFDDGPWPGTTAAVLDALGRECVRATFFLLGRNAMAHPELARRELAEGHTVAHHSFNHPLLDHMSEAAAVAEIDRGCATAHPVFSLSGFCFDAGFARSAGGAQDRGVRRRSLGKRLESDDSSAGTAPRDGAARCE
jgi:peptidoglycan/xylan/chitin deacetylase (PgdA/CDA1 family)